MMVNQRHHNLFVILTFIFSLVKFTFCEAINEMCEQVPVEMLRNAIGQAFNGRYMSENRPQETFIHIRDPGEELSFTVDAGFQKTLSDTPVWLGKRKSSSRTTFRPIFNSPVLDGNENKKQRMLHKNAKLAPVTVKMRGREYPTQSAQPMSREEEMTTQDELMQYTTKTNIRIFNRRVRRDRWHEEDVKPWLCEATKRWQDLGSDYFPRFLLSVDCSNRKCWYDEYACTPKSFTVKVLRRVKDYCIPKTGMDVNLVRLNANESLLDLSELWVWEERAVTFCCECGATYNR